MEKGIYRILIDYTTDCEGSYVSAYTAQLSPLEFHAPDVSLDPASSTAAMTVELSRGVSDFTLETVFSGIGYVSITNVAIAETSNVYKKICFMRYYCVCL